MPIIKSAKKKLKQDVQRTRRNTSVEKHYKEMVKKAVKARSEKAIVLAYSATDKAVKHKIIHKNKASHVKSALSKLLGAKSMSKTPSSKHATA